MGDGVTRSSKSKRVLRTQWSMSLMCQTLALFEFTSVREKIGSTPRGLRVKLNHRTHVK